MDFDPQKPFYFHRVDPKTGRPTGEKPQLPVLVHIAILLAGLFCGGLIGMLLR